METHCASCQKNTANESSSVRKTTQNRLTLLSNCAICGKKLPDGSYSCQIFKIILNISFKCMKH